MYDFASKLRVWIKIDENNNLCMILLVTQLYSYVTLKHILSIEESTLIFIDFVCGLMSPVTLAVNWVVGAFGVTKMKMKPKNNKNH